MSSKKIAEFSPGRVVLLGLLCALLLGTILLSLPCAQRYPISILDILFTTASCLCVTGLFTVPLSGFTFFGHCVILALIQIGGLGLITMTLFFMYLFMDVGLSTQLMAGQLLEIDLWKNIKNILLFIIIFTLIIETIGALFLFSIFSHDFPLQKALFLSIFHSISAFCNAGVWLFDYSSIQHYAQNPSVLTIMMILIFMGDLGFITYYEIMRHLQSRIENKRRHFSLHSKIIFYSSIVVICTAALIFWILERENVLESLSPSMTFLTALFQVISFRSAGFIITHPGNFQLATLLMIMVLGFIGSAPASTGGGIKITTFRVFLATVKAAINDRTAVEIRGRRIPKDQVNKAIAIVSLSLSWIILTTFLLLITEKGWSFSDLLFESVMAFANVGICMGITPTLSLAGKCFIMISMIIGRIGSLTLILAITFSRHKKTVEFSYPEERIMLG